MEGSDESGIMQRIHTSFGSNCSPSFVVNQGNNSNHNNNNNNVQLGFNGQLNNNSNGVLENNYGKRPLGIPPSHPHSNFGGIPSNFSVRPSHSRSLSQPSFLSFDQLPPLSPGSFRVSPTTSSERVSNEGSNVQGLSSLPPRRGHRRSSSDVALGLETMSKKPVQLVWKEEAKSEMVDDLLSVYMNFDGNDLVNSSSMEDKDSRASGGTRTNESSENEGESSGVSSDLVDRKERGKRSASGDIAPTGRHSRSLSMDSFMGNSNLFDESQGGRVGQHSRDNSMDGSSSLFSLEFGIGEFTPAELKKIMANEKLAEVAKVDPKRVKRILANRISAARSKERKMRYVSELEYKVQKLQTEATSLSAQVTLLQRDSSELTTQNNEMRFRVQAMEQQAHLRDALNEALNTEIQHLKIAAQMKGIHLAPQVMPNNHVFQMQSSHNMHPSQQFQKQAGVGPMQNEQSRKGGGS